ncbi:MAG: hypothetical protein U9Q22_05595 [Candidatus Altiarchaeota archaeon]|nr:hypothetical protein [Candidatus Altiarchaeota archaeon]
MKSIVLNNSVLSAFVKMRRLKLLKEILNGHRIYIADTVFREIIFQEVLDAVASGNWITVEEVNVDDFREPGIDDGEAGTVKLALQKKSVAVIDDLDGRKFAGKHQVKVIGTLALLKSSCDRGLITKFELKSILGDLEVKDAFRMSKELKDWILGDE